MRWSVKFQPSHRARAVSRCHLNLNWKFSGPVQNDEPYRDADQSREYGVFQKGYQGRYFQIGVPFNKARRPKPAGGSWARVGLAD